MTSRARVLAHLRQVCTRGYAITDGELVDGAWAVGAAIVHGGRMVGSVAVSGPTARLPLRTLHRMAASVRRTAAELATIWPHGVSAVDFGLGRDLTNGTGRNRSPRRQA